jgi:phytanoyl-CoA hydroxylase
MLALGLIEIEWERSQYFVAYDPPVPPAIFPPPVGNVPRKAPMLVASAPRHALFARDGYVVLPDCFTREDMAEAKRECARVIAEIAAEPVAAHAGNRNNGVVVGLAQRSAWLRALHGDPRLVDALAEIIGPNIEFWSDKLVYKSSKVDFGSPWHQDWPYWKGAHKFSVWIALDDASPENGCLRMIPGSHTTEAEHSKGDQEGIGFWNRLRPGAIDESRAVVMSVKAGTALIFHDQTLHCSYPNSSGRDRWAIISTYRDASAEDYDYTNVTAPFMVRGERIGRSLGPKLSS